MAKRKKTAGSNVYLEIGLDWFKIVQAEPGSKGVRVTRAHLEKYQTIGSNLSQAIASAFKKNKFPKVPVVASLPRQMVNLRLLELPSVDSREIDDMVGFQAGKQTHYSKDEIAYDYKIIGGGREGYTRVMLAIVQRSILRQRFSIIEEAGLEIAKMTVTSEGVLNWYKSLKQGKGKAAVFVDIASFYSDLIVMSGGTPMFTKSILIGADQLLGDPEKAKSQFVKEVESSLKVCQGESHDVDIGEILLSGAASSIEGLREYAGQELGLKAETINCLEKVARKPAAPSLTSSEFQALSLSSVIGMAMDPGDLEFNLVPESVKLRKSLVEKARNLTAFGVVVMLLLISFSAFLTCRLSFKKSRLKKLQTTISSIQPYIEKVEEKKAIIDVVRRRQDAKFASINLVAAIHGCVPQDTYLSEVDIDLEKMTLKLAGSSATMKDVNAFVGKLEDTPVLRNVKSESPSRDRNNRYSFSITSFLEVNGDN